MTNQEIKLITLRTSSATKLINDEIAIIETYREKFKGFKNKKIKLQHLNAVLSRRQSKVRTLSYSIECLKKELNPNY